MDVFYTTFVLLVFFHFLADFPLQGDFMAKAKNPQLSSKEVWPVVLTGHCMIHAGFVLLVTNSLALAFLQFASHFTIDYAKCVGWLGGRWSFLVDQLLHVAVLLFIAISYFIHHQV